MTKDVATWDTFQERTQTWVEFGPKDKKRKYKIQNLTGEEYDEITSQPTPKPPHNALLKDESGRPIMINNAPQYGPNYDDENFRKELDKANKIRITKIIEFGLVVPNGKEIPGKTSEEKYEFLKKGNIGDIIKLSDLILNELTNLKPGDVDFLSES